MAYLYVRKNDRVEVREAHSTPRGPRSRTLGSFKPPLSEEHLEQAEAAATRPFDRHALRARAKALGIPFLRSSADAHARALISRLRRGDRLDPVLAEALKRRLGAAEPYAVADAAGDVIEWIGASDHERGRALRDVLRLYDTIARSRGPTGEPERPRFPCFSVRAGRRAS